MTLQEITKRLIDDYGFSQVGLARELTARGASCTQPTIFRILAGGETTDTIGHAIRTIFAEKTRAA